MTALERLQTALAQFRVARDACGNRPEYMYDPAVSEAQGAVLAALRDIAGDDSGYDIIVGCILWEHV